MIALVGPDQPRYSASTSGLLSPRLPRPSRKLLLEQGDVGFEKLQSVFAGVRMWGGGIPLAYAVQGIVSVAVVCGTAWTWSSAGNRDLKSALLVDSRRCLASPHVLDYDLWRSSDRDGVFCPPRHPPTVFAITRSACWPRPGSFRCWRAGIAGATGMPLGLLVLLALYVCRSCGARSDREHIGMAAASATESRKRDLICSAVVSGIIFCAVAVRQRFSTFSIVGALRPHPHRHHCLAALRGDKALLVCLSRAMRRI